MSQQSLDQPLWRPSATRKHATQMTAFMNEVGLADVDYQTLWQWSVDQPEAFWSKVWQFCALESIAGDLEPVVENITAMPGARWFPSLTLNFAQNLLRKCHDSECINKAALVFRDEQGHRQALTYGELYVQVTQLASALKQSGVIQGDRVVGFIPNVPEAVIGMLATTSIGAVWSSCSPDFGLQGVLDRFGQIAPKAVITTNGYYYGGKALDLMDKVTSIIGQLPSVNDVIMVDYIATEPSGADNSALECLNSKVSCRVHSWINYLDASATEIDFCAVSFDHPLYVMYSSGTTGVPKCMVHSVGGTLIQHAKELILHTDVTQTDTLFYYTTCGWMMWNWLVSGLMTGATVVLYDGSPFYPGPDVLWQMAEEESVSIFGTSAKYLAALQKADYSPSQHFSLDALKSILSTGSPLAHESYDYVYHEIKADLCLSSISGGTDIISCFALGNPNLPVWRGELQCLGLGMAVSIYDDRGQPVVSEKGELVCEHAFPSMPTRFWNDSDGKKFKRAYFDAWPNVWAHGDYGELIVHSIEGHSGLVIHGRSDAVLNPGGVRIGTAEIYRQVEKVAGVVESIAVGQQMKQDVRVVLFVVLKDGVSLDKRLISEIKSTIRSNTTPRHVPEKVIQVADIPRTISGKIVELAVRNVIHGEPVKNTDALKNPEALALYENLKL